jgi:hypothetical protein
LLSVHRQYGVRRPYLMSAERCAKATRRYFDAHGTHQHHCTRRVRVRQLPDMMHHASRRAVYALLSAAQPLRVASAPASRMVGTTWPNMIQAAPRWMASSSSQPPDCLLVVYRCARAQSASCFAAAPLWVGAAAEARRVAGVVGRRGMSTSSGGAGAAGGARAGAGTGGGTGVSEAHSAAVASAAKARAHDVRLARAAKAGCTLRTS